MSPGEPKRRHVRGFAAHAVKNAPVKLVRGATENETFDETKSLALESTTTEPIALKEQSSRPVAAEIAERSSSEPVASEVAKTNSSEAAASAVAETDSPEPIASKIGSTDSIEPSLDSADPMIAASTPNEPAASGTPVCVATEDGGNPSLSLSQQATEVSKKFDKECQGIIDWLLTLRAPLALIAALAMVPHLINLWIVAILVKPLVSWGLPRCPQPLVDKMQSLVPQSMRRSEFLRDLGEGTDQGLPFILFWLYIFCVPFALCWMAAHWVKDLMPTHSKPTVSSESAEAQIVFTQNKKSDSAQSDSNFYHSKAFGIVLVLFFALGIPAYISLGVYEKLGVSKAVEHEKNVVPLFDMPSDLPQAEMPALGIVSRGGHHGKHQMPVAEVSQGEDATYVAGYNSYWPVLKNLGIEPTLKSIFFVHFYLIGLASALTILFFRAWFTFPLNFLRDEHDVEFTASGIKKRTMKGWFLSVITINRWSIGGGPDSLRWHEVKSLRHLEEGFTKLYPLPDTAFRKESLTYKLLNKCAAFFDGLTNQANAENFLVFSASKKGNDFGRNIQINLKELNREQRARLFYLVKQWAPHVEIMKNVEEKLIGSTVLTDVRYTQLWFDLLTSKARPQRQNVLCVGDTLKNNQFTIDERLSSGGQATTYLARNSAGAKCVLKEFILATSSTSGALIESAREFEAEVSLLSQLRHPGIVRLEDYFCEDGRVYVVLEYIAGQSLRQMVSQVGPLDQQEVVRIGLAICDVLEYLHGCNPPIVHRDITPENIIIQPDGAIKLIDFSLAVKQDGRPTTDSCAKQAFTPPEQFREEVCVQSDIYALGATMYYLLLAENPKPISRSSPMAKAPHVMPKLNAIVERATELDLHHRYESVAWLKLDLEQTKTD